MKPRSLGKIIGIAGRTFPAMVITGPRQSGKTTLLKQLFGKTHGFVSMENTDIRLRAKEDPLGFLEGNAQPLVLDEVQYAPELLPYIKTKIDEDRKPCQWILSGSQNFALMQGVTESLAGRAAIFTLLPFSAKESVSKGDKVQPVTKWLEKLGAKKSTKSSLDLYHILLRGCYPEPSSNHTVNREIWCGSYLATYAERDVRTLAQVGDLNQFERFLKSCAIRTGQILNLTDMARDIGISVPTAKRWLSILEASFQVYLLYPYYRNLQKRIIKAPKLYFMDTGLATFLMGIHNKETLAGSQSLGHLFETLIITDTLKRFLHQGIPAPLYYVRTRDGLEIDLLIEINEKLYAIEIKHTATVTPRHASSLQQFQNTKSAFPIKTFLVSRGDQGITLGNGVKGVNWKNYLLE